MSNETIEQRVEPLWLQRQRMETLHRLEAELQQRLWEVRWEIHRHEQATGRSEESRANVPSGVEKAPCPDA